MSITSEPILLNSTALAIADEIDRQNGYLAILAESKRTEIFSSMTKIANIIRTGDVESNRKIFQIGDQIVMPWKNMDDSEHNIDATAWEMPWDIVHHGTVTLKSGEEVPGMYLQSHYVFPQDMCFDGYEAFYTTDTALAAGTYNVIFDTKYGQAAAGSVWNFTLTQPVPAGGKLSGFKGMNTADPSTWTVISWDTVPEVIESVAVSSGDAGTNLCTISVHASNTVNARGRMALGYGRWAQSVVRQWLNASGTGWWTPQNRFDLPSSLSAQRNCYGFISGFDEEFLAAIRPIQVSTTVNTTDGGTIDTTYDRFFLPSLEQMNINPDAAVGSEGEAMDLWKQRSGSGTFVERSSSINRPEYVASVIGTSGGKAVFLRSSYLSSYDPAYRITAGGSVGGNSASSTSNGCRPVCVVC